ncbi:hypothetical protein GYMLUDRAFT_41129 [Collybiopsis luxurians FD-317 M1]|uniref:FAD/NAD(P)-binding domain-containing protein n=1 Tax=Collybiopsis luxurians FD-317 M1 TaxID=944289 RepID=A0A0D0BHK5_9AGAR|nr:hypothetical protein GYMLUDRAFT_41129 [Collybiopsis luxurians FD-317 M1]
MQDYDVIIIGAGPAGCATALAIAKRNTKKCLRALVVDNADCSAYKIGESLPAAARPTLSMLHPTLLSQITQDTANGLHEMCTGNASAWASPDLHETYSLMNPYGAGWHLDRALFDETLRKACDSMLCKGKFIAVRRIDRTNVDLGQASIDWEVDVESAEQGNILTFRAQWLVDATGRRAVVASKIGAKMDKHLDLLSFYLVLHKSDIDHYQDSATSSKPTEDTDSRTLIESAPSGWWYSARLPHDRRLIMYTTTPSDPSARIARKVTGFMDMVRQETTHITKAMGDEAWPLYEPSTAKFTQCTAAGSSVLRPYASWESAPAVPGCSDAQGLGRGWCAIGDAALAFDPLSSQGIITALKAGALLGSLLANYFYGRDNPPVNPQKLDGEGVVRTISEAYEHVRIKYEEGRSYYYNAVSRFDPTDEQGIGDTKLRGGNFRVQQRELKSH